VRGLVAGLAAVGAILVLAGSGTAGIAVGVKHDAQGAAKVNSPWSGLTVGVNDDTGKLDVLRDWFFPTLAADGLTLNTITLSWDDGDPISIPGQKTVGNAIADAQTQGVSIELDLYPLHSQVFTGGKKCRPSADPEACGNSIRIQQFADWVSAVAAAFPSVHQFVVMNECNQPLFVNPQWNAAGQNQSAAICGRALAAAYDALKAVDRSNFVWGVGLSPRGNDNAKAASNSSTSPVKFIGYLGAWFKAFAKKTYRTAPLMDGFDFHPYPVPQSLPFAIGYSNLKDASITNLPRIYQAFYDAFAGSPQKTIGQQKGGGLPVSLNETGIQTASPGNDNLGFEVSATPAGGVLGQWATQAYQAKWYVQMLNLVSCDPNVHLVNIFHLLDETELGGWQSGLYFASKTPKQSAAAVRSWILSTGAACHGTPAPWKPGFAAATPLADRLVAQTNAKTAPSTKTAKTEKAQAANAQAAKAQTAKAEAEAAKAEAAAAETARAEAAKAEAAKAEAARAEAEAAQAEAARAEAATADAAAATASPAQVPGGEAASVPPIDG
jgi:hypothetical protein